eukprot:TRINITY_DN5220_c0_g2_i1.p1 TRINITY_DN5220_c0_g2~~TRINITY_DN5220_c0_g2_i1.p1  ORF type:complete len:574 (+),score=231.37 TRINITY_DN5220_c0_g2_i1:103-1824(+)
MSWDGAAMKAIPTPQMTYDSMHTVPQDEPRRYASASAGSAAYDRFSSHYASRRVSGVSSHQSRGISGHTLSTVSGPSIFIPGTTITKEDIDLMTMRYESEIEQLRIELSESQGQVMEQAALVRELTHELDKVKTREARLKNETVQKDQSNGAYEKKIAALSALLDASEKELVARGKEADRLKTENIELKTKLATVEADLQAEAKEADTLRARVQQMETEQRSQDNEMKNIKSVLDKQQEESAKLSRVNGLYKATHGMYLKEGHLAAQLAETVESLKKEVTESRSQLCNLQSDRLSDVKALLKEQTDELNTVIALSTTVEELVSATTLPQTIRARGNMDEWRRCVADLKDTVTSKKELDTPHLKMLAAMNEMNAEGRGIDLTALKREIEALQSSSARDDVRGYLETIKLSFQRVTMLLRIFMQEVRSAASVYSQQQRQIETLGDEVSAAKAQQEPLVNQLQRLGDQLTQQQQEVGLKQALLEKEQKNYNQQLQHATEEFNKEEEILKSRLDEAYTENDRMKSFMAKLQIADVPQLHSLLAAAASTSRKTRAYPTPHSSVASVHTTPLSHTHTPL